jgi:hypothetical protein
MPNAVIVGQLRAIEGNAILLSRSLRVILSDGVTGR